MMRLKNQRLSFYIQENTDSKIRSRASQVGIDQLEFSVDHQSVSAMVFGSSGKKYEVYFYGLQDGILSSSCTCPYDWGNVCKHEVAVAREIDAFVDNKALIDSISPTQKTNATPNYTKSGPYELPFKQLKDFTNNYIRKHASKTAIAQMDYALFDVSIIVNEQEYIHIRLDSHYRYDSAMDVQLRKKKNILSLLCSCKALNKALCLHQTIALQFLRDELPLAFESTERINTLKQKMLDAYDLSLTNKAHQKLFCFEFRDGNLELVLIEGILGSKDLENFEPYIDKLFTWKGSLKDRLPYKTKTKNLKKKGFAVGFIFHDENYHQEPPISLIPIMGNLKKDESGFSSKIEVVSDDDLLHRPELFREDELELIRKTLELTENFPQLVHHKEAVAIDHYLHNKLKTLIPLLKGKLLYTVDPYRKLGKHNLVPITVLDHSSTLSFKIKKESPFYVLQSFVTVDGKKRKMNNAYLGNNFLFTEENNIFYLNRDITYSKTLKTFKDTPEMRIPESDLELFYDRFIIPLSQNYPVDFPEKKPKLRKIPTNELEKKLYLTEENGYIIFRPILDHKGKFIDILGYTATLEKDKKETYILQVEPKIQHTFLNQIIQTNPRFKEQQEQGILYLDSDEFMKDNWFLNVFPKFKEMEIQVFGYDTLESLKYNPHTPTINLSVNSGLDWFDVQLTVAFGDMQVSLRDLKKSMVANEKYIRLSDGSLGILPEEWLEKYRHLFRTGTIKKNGIEVSRFQLSVIDTLYEHLDPESGFAKKHLELKKKLTSFKTIKNIKKPKEITANLRKYQKEGLNWLNFLHEYTFGGCLADDMGLGKTVQVISFLQYLKETKSADHPHLIVMPTSLIFNWAGELAKFCASMNYLQWTGTERLKKKMDFSAYDLVLTTYGTLLRDIEQLKEQQFGYLILDESQAIKNPNSKRFKTVRLLKGEHRLVMTGTPIENNIFDLYAQMTFVNPGLLGNITNFKKEYAQPIEKDKNTVVANELRQLIAPFLLRRTKEKVAKELPPKTEQLLYCTMEKEQRAVYDAYRNKYRDYLMGKIEEDGLGKSKLYVLEGLTKLRQICDAPKLLSDEGSFTSASVKIKELMLQIKEKTGEHKILIFSQFVKMLHSIETRLKQEGILYEYLDGRTKNRKEKVDNFQENAKVRVFLISLKAGGTGLNLTAADYVYIVDPWWNPAVEAQAIDRCYRIGQNKKVMAYKMICKDTIEEKIMALQASKKQLSSDIIQTDDNFIKSLDKKAIQELFSS